MVGSLCCSGVHVFAVNPERRRAGNALVLGRLDGVNGAKLDWRVNASLVEEFSQSPQECLVGGGSHRSKEPRSARL
jgi:hypothetical protein